MIKKHTKPNRIMHTMFRVHNLDRSIEFYCGVLGMQEMRRENFTEDRFTLVFLGYQNEEEASVIELTYNWDETPLTRGNQFGHIALEVENFGDMSSLFSQSGVSYTRPPGPMKSKNDAGGAPEFIAFIEDPDGNQIELIRRQKGPEKAPEKTQRVNSHPLLFL